MGYSIPFNSLPQVSIITTSTTVIARFATRSFLLEVFGLWIFWVRVQSCQTSFEKKKPNHVQKKPNGVKKAKRSKKSQIVKNHETLAFSMFYHVFSKVVNTANSTVTDHAHGNLKFSHFQCITFAAWSLNNFEGSLSCWWNSSPMFLGFFMIHQVTEPWYNCSVA